MQNQSKSTTKTKKAKSTPDSNARPIGMIRLAYGEGTALSKIMNCSRAVVSYNIKNRNPEYLNALYELRWKAEQEFSRIEEKFAALRPAQ